MAKEISFKELIKLTEDKIKRFEKIEGKPWKVEGSMIELSKQVGELSRLVMVVERYYFPNRFKQNPEYKANKDKVADELADIMYCLIRIARHYNIDLVEANLKARENEDIFLKSKGV